AADGGRQLRDLRRVQAPRRGEYGRRAGQGDGGIGQGRGSDRGRAGGDDRERELLTVERVGQLVDDVVRRVDCDGDGAAVGQALEQVLQRRQSDRRCGRCTVGEIGCRDRRLPVADQRRDQVRGSDQVSGNRAGEGKIR